MVSPFMYAKLLFQDYVFQITDVYRYASTTEYLKSIQAIFHDNLARMVDFKNVQIWTSADILLEKGHGPLILTAGHVTVSHPLCIITLPICWNMWHPCPAMGMYTCEFFCCPKFASIFLLAFNP